MLETSIPKLISLTLTSLQILDKIQMKIFSISRFLLKSLINRNCHKTNINVGMEHGLLSKTEERNNLTSLIKE